MRADGQLLSAELTAPSSHDGHVDERVVNDDVLYYVHGLMTFESHSCFCLRTHSNYVE